MFMILPVVPKFSITPTNITVPESTPVVEVCIVAETSLARGVVVTVETGPKNEATAQATGSTILYIYCNLTSIPYLFDYHVVDSDYVATTVMLTFAPSDETDCTNITIINDIIGNEPAEEFSVTLTSSSPVGTFGENTTCVTIIDDDRKCLSCDYS